MYIVLLSQNQLLAHSLLAQVDSILTQKKISSLSLYSHQSYTLPQLISISSSLFSSYILIDTLTYPDLSHTMSLLKKYLPQCLFGLVSNEPSHAAYFLNNPYPTYGFLDFTSTAWKTTLSFILSNLKAYFSLYPQKLLVTVKDISYLLDYEDIFLIETIKETHYCMIHHQNGDYKMRSNIKLLKTTLDKRFFQIRSSTIVNLDFIRKINVKLRQITLKNGFTCTYTHAVEKKLLNTYKERVQASLS